MIGNALALIALAALLGLAIHICKYRLIEAISRAWIDAQTIGQTDDDLSDRLTHDGDTRAANLLRPFFHDGEI